MTLPDKPPYKIVPVALREKLSSSADVDKDSIRFTLPADSSALFDLSSGPIVEFQILVVAGERNNQYRDGAVTTWSQAKRSDFNIAYAAEERKSVPNEWKSSSQRRRRSASNGLLVSIGTEDCDDGSTHYCNGHLKSNTHYCVYARGWTSSNSPPTDSDCFVVVETDRDDTVVIVVCVVVIVVILAALVAMFVILKVKGLWPFQTDSSKQNHSLPLQEVPPPHRPSTPPPEAVSLEDFIEKVNDMHKDQDYLFSREYQKLKELSPQHSHQAAVLPCNTPKNRWVDILPFDHSRVKLLPADEEEGSDYINANYLPGYNSRREYIATQGPLPGTMDHFWRMVWEQHVTMIVMLTQCVERGKRKCELYWPTQQEEPFTYGDIMVTLRSESSLPEYTIRIFDIQMGDQSRSVKQFFVSAWPDFGCPDSSSTLLNLVRVVRSHMRPDSSGPLLVHCSAGVGRTGTYVIVDRILQHIQDHDELDVFNMVLELRGYRCRMVQTEDQYIYIHNCVKEALETGMSRRYKPQGSDSNQQDDGSDQEEHIYENTNGASPQMLELNGVRVDVEDDNATLTSASKTTTSA